MSRLINLVLFSLVLLGAFWLYQVKHQAKIAEKEIAKLEKEIRDEKEALLLLKAEWSYLNRPERIQELTKRFSEQLGLSALEPHQIGKADDLPDRVADEGIGQGSDAIGALLGKVTAKKTLSEDRR